MTSNDPIKFDQSRSSQNVSSSDSTTSRERRVPNRNFKEIADKLGDKEEQSGEDAPDQKIVKKETPKKTSESGGMLSPFELASQTGSQHDAAGQESRGKINIVDRAETKAKYQQVEVKEEFSLEQPDIAYFNPNTVAAAETFIPEKPQEVTQSKPLQEIINKLVDEIKVVEQSDRTETTITFKNPPLLEGARLTVTGFDSARGEFNISFDNLNPDAKRMLDLEANQLSLRQALEQKGYTVHIVVITTTTIENPIADVRSSPNRDRENQQQQQGDSQKRNNEEEEQ